MYPYGAFSDAALPMRHGKWTEVCPQDVMAAIIKDAAHLEILHTACEMASKAFELASKLKGLRPSGVCAGMWRAQCFSYHINFTVAFNSQG
jgi:hypothetical protein